MGMLGGGGVGALPVSCFDLTLSGLYGVVKVFHLQVRLAIS